MNIAERLNEFHASYLKTKGYGGRNVLEIELGKKPGYLTTAAKRNTTISSDVIEVIVRKFTDLNIIWLITGEGQMLKESSLSPPASEKEVVYKELFERKEKELSDLRTEKDGKIKELERKVWELEQELQVFTSRKKTVQEPEDAAGAADIMDGMVG